MAKRQRSLNKKVTSPQHPAEPVAPKRKRGSPRAADIKPPHKLIISPRVRALIGELIDNPDQTLQKAGERAGYAPAYAASQASRALKRPSAQELFRQEMAKRPKLQFSALAEKLEQGLEATVTKYFAHEGSVVDERENTDYSTRATYLTLAARLAGADPAGRMELTGKDGKDLNLGVQQVVLPPMSREEMLAWLDRAPEPVDVPCANCGHVPGMPLSLPTVAADGAEGKTGDDGAGAETTH
jgi:hypothetical protein